MSYTASGYPGITRGTYSSFRANAPFNNVGSTPVPGTMNIEAVGLWEYMHDYLGIYAYGAGSGLPSTWLGWVGWDPSKLPPDGTCCVIVYNDGFGGKTVTYIPSSDPPDSNGNYYGTFSSDYLISANVEECFQIQWPWLSDTSTRLTFFERTTDGAVPINISYKIAFGQQVGYNFLTSTRTNTMHTGIGGTYDTGTGTGSQVSPDRQVRYNGTYRSFDQPYPGAPVALKVGGDGNAGYGPMLVDVFTDSDGNYSEIFTQSLSDTIDTWIPAQVVDPTGNSAPKLHAKHFGAFQLHQPLSIPVDDCTALTGWAAGPNAVLSINGDGFLQAVVSGGPGSLTRTFGTGGNSWEFDGIDLGCYRYMDVDVISTPAGGPVTLSIPIACDVGEMPDIGYPAKEWAWQAGGLHALDLMLPTWPSHLEMTDTGGILHRVYVDNTDTRYRQPWDGPGHIWGVAGTASLTFKNLAPGTYVFRGISQFRLEYSKLDIIASGQLYRGNPVKEFFEGELRNCFGGVRLLLGNTDGHQSLEGFSSSTLIHNPDYPLPVDAVSPDTTIQSLLARIALMPGWVATDLAPGDAFYNNQLVVDWLHGSGMMWTPGDGWTTFLQQDVSTAKTIYCQPVFDSIEFYPGIGDPFYNDGTYSGDGVFPARFHWQGRGLFHGMIAADPGGPTAGDHGHVRGFQTSGGGLSEVLAPTGDDFGNGTTDTQGYFRTGTPWCNMMLLDANYYGVTVDEFPTPVDFLIAAFFGVYLFKSDLRVYHQVLNNDRNMFAAYFRYPLRGGFCDRILVLTPGLNGQGARVYSDGTNLLYVPMTYAAGGLACIDLALPAVIAQGRAPAGFRDPAGVAHLWYARDGNIYYRQEHGSGWEGEMLSLTGYDCPAVEYLGEDVGTVHRAIMPVVSGGRLKVETLLAASQTDLHLTPDLTREQDLGLADSVCGAVKRYPNGVLQLWWNYGGNQLTKASYDHGLSWVDPIVGS